VPDSGEAAPAGVAHERQKEFEHPDERLRRTCCHRYFTRLQKAALGRRLASPAH